MPVVDFLRGRLENLSNTIRNGTFLLATDKKQLYVDIDDERIRINPPADWNESDSEKPSYIANKPTTVDGYGITNGAKIYYNTVAGWNANPSLKSEHNAFYIYTDAVHTHQGYEDDVVKPNVKVGDGMAFVIDLPFLGSDFIDHINDTTVHITEAERLFWNEKCRVDTTDIANEHVIFTTN